MQYLYQGIDTNANAEYDALPWGLGLLEHGADEVDLLG